MESVGGGGGCPDLIGWSDWLLDVPLLSIGSAHSHIIWNAKLNWNNGLFTRIKQSLNTLRTMPPLSLHSWETGQLRAEQGVQGWARFLNDPRLVSRQIKMWSQLPSRDHFFCESGLRILMENVASFSLQFSLLYPTFSLWFILLFSAVTNFFALFYWSLLFFTRSNFFCNPYVQAMVHDSLTNSRDCIPNFRFDFVVFIQTKFC